MASLEDLGEVIYTDVLIIGGGIGGLVTAVKAKEQPVDVLIVDEATVGWSGKAPKGGGILWLLTPEDDLDKFAEHHVRKIGDYLNDQELLYSHASETYAAVEQLADWGVKAVRDGEGRLDTTRHYLTAECSLTGVDLDMLLPLRAKARKMGTKILNKIKVIELIKQGERVIGAVGFDIIDGRFYIFKAKATVLANGSCCYKVMRMWSSACGDGIAAAYRAGAEMRNAEFGNFYDVMRKDTSSAVPRGHRFLVNSSGENISERYIPEEESGDICIAIVLGVEKEINEGRGPIYLDLEKMSEFEKEYLSKRSGWHRPHFDNFYGRSYSKGLKYGPPPSTRPEIALTFHGELSPIKVDHEMKTSLAGLWAIGDTSYMGSAWAGAVPAPPGRIRGSGLMNATLSALRGSPSAALFASETSYPEVNYSEVKRLNGEIFAPMRHDKGISPNDAIYAIQEAVCPIKYNMRRSKVRLEEALSRIEEIKQRLPLLSAKDGHGLGKCHEAKNMALCAEMTFRSALMRTESRGWHFMEDYPERDDRNWLKWIIIKQEAGNMALSTEPVPIDKYKFKP